MFRYRLAARAAQCLGRRSCFVAGPGLFQRWKVPSERQPCRQMTTSNYSWQRNKTLYTSVALGIFAIGNAFYAYVILKRARQRDVDRAERNARMASQMKSLSEGDSSSQGTEGKQEFLKTRYGLSHHQPHLNLAFSSYNTWQQQNNSSFTPMKSHTAKADIKTNATGNYYILLLRS
uniref:Uncharacterized protein n=1 Tax=Micrurus carvalhoi TaxID=3147026 RepID=A0A2H6MY52_9SAUR